jgi:hypothetical protein
MERTTMCIDSTFTPVDASLCKGPAPVTKAVCNPNPCPGHCLKPGCSDCAAGFVGTYCEVRPFYVHAYCVSHLDWREYCETRHILRPILLFGAATSHLHVLRP